MDVLITTCSNSDYNKIARAITEFNLSHLPPHTSENMFSLGYVIKEPVWGIIGGITARILLGNCLSIEILWVEKDFRNKGYATQLLNHLEQEARKLGSKLSIVDTFDFQALGFYEKCGYTTFGVLDDCPCPGNTRYYLKKVL